MRKNVKWTMLLTYLISFVLVLVLAGNASAANVSWDAGGGANKLWSDGNNWNTAPPTVPTIADAAFINNPPNADALIDATVDACGASLDVGFDTNTCYLTMTGGTLITNGNITVGRAKTGATDANGVFSMTGGIVRNGNSRLWVGYGIGTVPSAAEDSFGTFTMTTGCDVNVGAKIEMGKNDTGNGQINVNGGTLWVGYVSGNEDFEIGKYGTGTLNVTGGEVNVVDAIKLSESGGTATIYISGGNIYCNDLTMKGGNPTIYLAGGRIWASDSVDLSGANVKIDINEGILSVGTDTEQAEIEAAVSAGKIIGYHGDGYVIVTPPGGGEGDIIVTASLYDPNLASGASPGNYATVDWTPAGPTLSWTAGQKAYRHDVYFGTDFDDVNDANTTSPEFKGSQDPCSYAFPVPPPVFSETYYWRIDENDACSPATIWKGLVWQFKMAGYEEVEDFNSYANDAALQAVWTVTGSSVTREITKVRSGYSMKYIYTNTNPTEAYASTTGANKLPVDINDWTTADIKALVLYFYGDAGNTAETMYVALRSTDNNLAVVYYDGDANDLKVPEWHEWNIELSDFSVPGPNAVDLSSVDKVYVGFGTRGSPPANGGTVYFEDIRLYPRRCRAELAPVGDIAGPDDGKDCSVDFIDVNVMKNEWLETDYNGVGRDGVVKGGAAWVNDGTRGRCIQLDGVDDWVDINDDDLSNFHDKTVAFWVNVSEYPAVFRYLFYFSDGNSTNPYRVYLMTYTPASFYVRARFIDSYTAAYTAGQNVWTHLAFVLRDTIDGKCTGEFYADGTLIDNTLTGKPRHSGAAVGVNIGSENDGKSAFVKALIDDFRVYGYALSAAEISTLYNATLMPGGSGTAPDANMLLHYDFNETSGTVADNSSTYVYYHPLLADAELYAGEAQGSRIVNFRDFAVLADNWLEEKLWP